MISDSGDSIVTDKFQLIIRMITNNHNLFTNITYIPYTLFNVIFAMQFFTIVSHFLAFHDK